MSKVLKVIVNLFLVCAILVAAGILVPPLLGVSTTVIDSSSMETNLSVGSVTYSKDVNVTEIAVGDKILSETDTKTYAYVVEAADAASGHFTVLSAKDSQAEPEDITLRNTVSKIVITVPAIGYIMIAMHSVEGLIIIGLVVLFIIILFILSELWKKSDDDGDEDEEESDARTQAELLEDQPVMTETPSPEYEPEDSSLEQIKAELQKEADSDGETEEETAQTGGESPEEAAGEVQTVAAAAEEAQPEEVPVTEAEEDTTSFAPVARAGVQELLARAEEAGEQPVVTKDEHTKVTILDYSNII